MKTISISFYPIVFLLYCFLLPREIFFELSEIKSILDFFGKYIPVFDHFNNNSAFPNLFSFAILMGFLLIPIQIYLVDKTGAIAKKISSNRKTTKGIFEGVVISMFLIVYLTNILGSNIEGTSKLAQIIKSIMSNRIYFSLYIGFGYLILAIGLSGTYIYLKKTISIKGN